MIPIRSTDYWKDALHRIESLERALFWIQTRAEAEDGPFAAKVAEIAKDALILPPT